MPPDDLISSALQTEISDVFELQREHKYAVARTTAKERIKKLERLKQALFRHQQEIRDAMKADFRKHQVEVDLTELFLTKDEINHAQRNLSRWMRPLPVGKSLMIAGSRSWVRYEPKGVSLILSSWNFPVLLTLAPLATAIAAGNCAIVKPSESAPRTSALLKSIMEGLFPKEEVYLVEGGAEVARVLLQHPFNHIYFIGSTRVGRQVMEAASKHLASVTLEMGGKSPVIIDETADIPVAANRVAWGKFLNSGQSCVAPDNLWIHHRIEGPFLEALKREIRRLTGPSAQSSPDYARIINEFHFQRLKEYLDDALDKGASVEFGGELDHAEYFIGPTLLKNAPFDSLVMQEEVFGPLLPYRTFASIDEPIDYLRKRPHPLALYIFSRKRSHVRKLIAETRAGSTAINENAVQFFQIRYPFGGFNESGIGKGHGHAGFLEFSNARGVFRQGWPDLIPLIMPPYNDFRKRLAEMILKWL